MRKLSSVGLFALQVKKILLTLIWSTESLFFFSLQSSREIKECSGSLLVGVCSVSVFCCWLQEIAGTEVLLL